MVATFEELEKFVTQVKLLHTIDFPRVAEQLGLDWHNDLYPRLKVDMEFRAKLECYLQSLKFMLLDKVLISGIQGKKGYGQDPETSYINAIIKHIDSGSLLGEIPEEEIVEEESQGPTPEEVERHLKRLNLPNETDS